jgi:hypothetical protein
MGRETEIGGLVIPIPDLKGPFPFRRERTETGKIYDDRLGGNQSLNRNNRQTTGIGQRDEKRGA